jgi:hypothetical protein
MTYLGYKSREEILEMVKLEFPFQPKPDGYLLTSQGEEDCICRYIVEHMDQYKEPKIPLEGIGYLHSELGNISVAGMSWLLPNLLRRAVLCTNKFDTLADTMIYDLDLIADGDYEVEYRYLWLSSSQKQCIESTLEFLSEEHGIQVSTAIAALETLDS